MTRICPVCYYSAPVLQKGNLSMIQDSFKNHKLSEADKLWLQVVATDAPFDPRIAKVKLYRRLPKDFDFTKIDRRLLSDNELTPIGLWHVDQSNPLFKMMDIVVRAVREVILNTPGITTIPTIAIADETGLSVDQVGKVLYQLGKVGHFYSGADWGTDPRVIASIQLSDSSSYDQYLNYNGIDEMLQSSYITTKPSQYAIKGDSKLFWSTWDATDADALSSTTKPIKAKTAFVLMAMDQSKPELVDVYAAIKDVCREFGINAYRADDIEHQERITDLILREIQTCEHLIADLTYERPNVYYEVGYAHAIDKKPILYRKSGTPLHFDLAVHNVPEYKNVTELRDMLRKRFEAILGRQPREKVPT